MSAPHATTAPPDTVLVGCGRLGAEVGLRLAAQGRRVLGVRRQADLVPPPMEGLAADLLVAPPELPELELDLVVVALTARPRTEDSYRATYVDAMLRALDALEQRGSGPRRAVLVSSTAVNGDSTELITEDTEPDPRDAPAQVLLEAERRFRDRLPQGVVLRLSGLYGPGRPRMVDEVLSGQVGDLARWTNRIHRDDAAEAVVHLATRVDDPAPLYLGTDDEPALKRDVAAHVAALLGVEPPPPVDPAEGHGKRLSNARLRATGWVPMYPTYREGYVLDPDS